MSHRLLPHPPRTVLALAGTILALGTALAPPCARANSGTPPINRTGAPGHLTCAQCHTSTGSGSATLDFAGLGSYQAGETYAIDIVLNDPGQRRWGFSMVARDTDNNTADVGSWAAGGADTQVYGAGGRHVGHRNAPRMDNAYTFTVNWTAPATAVGDVTFYLAANAANGNGSNGAGDNVYLTTLTISEAVVTNLPPAITRPPGLVHATTGLPAPVRGLALGDPDAADGELTLTLAAENGTVTVAEGVSGGITTDDITDNGTPLVTVTATLDELNATLADPAGLTYQSTSGFLGTEMLALTIDDNGHTGPGGPQSDTAELLISVNLPAALDDLRLAEDGSFQFTLNGEAERTYVLETSEDLATWTFLTEVTLAGTTTTPLADPGAEGVPTRFYRSREITP